MITTASDEFWAGVRAELPILLGVAPFGMIYGVVALASGLPPLAAQAMSLIVMGIITYLIRLSLLGLLAQAELTAVIHRALNFVPVAVLAAIIAPELVQPGGVVDLSWGNGRLIAGSTAIIVAWFSKSALWPVAAGMLLLWLLQS